MKTLTSIENIEKVFDTGCKPLLVHANDLNFYVCKYNTGVGSAEKLYREYIAASFAKLWNIATPGFSTIKILKEHLPPELGITSINLKCPCFGSLYHRDYKEVDKFLYAMSDYHANKFINPEEYLTIAFFDLWLSNEDRHQGNFNLFMSVEDNSYHFIAYDHEMIFNSGNLSRGLSLLTEDESILSGPLLMKLFSVKDITNNEYLVSLQKKWYNSINQCEIQAKTIINQTPDEWLTDKENQYELLLNHLFKPDWKDQGYKKFLEYIQLNLNKSHENNI